MDHSENRYHTTSQSRQTDHRAVPASNFSEDQSSTRLSSAMELLYMDSTECSVDRESRGILSPQVEIFHEKPSAVSNLIYSEFEPLGQLDRSFILMQGKPGILVVDQHIAHERVLYDRFKKAAKNKKIEVQQLLFPLTMEYSPSEVELLIHHQDSLSKLGLELELFGENEFLLRTVPAILKNNDKEEIMREIVDMLPAQKHEEALFEKFEDILIMMSCRNAIKVNMSLNLDQIRKLISDLQETEMPYTCPHGRPIALLYDMDSILKKFLRK